MCLDENGRRLNVGGKKCTHVIYGGCVCVGTADNEGFDLEMLGVFNHSGEVNGSSVDGSGAV